MNKKLLYIFLVIAMAKIYISLQFSTPFIFQDEYSYSYLARNIVLNPISIINSDIQYPPGYSLLLSLSFKIFYPNMGLVYRSILITNIILSTSILFISYMILREFVKDDIAIFGSILITALPSTTLYNFLIFSENIYISLFLLSGYLVVKSFEKNDKFFHIATGFVIFFLTIIRTFGMFAYISFFVVVLYNIYKENQKTEFLKKNCYLIFTPIILLIQWNVLKKIYGSNIYGYDNVEYIKSLSYIFGDSQHFILFIKLVLHEIDYLIIASYVIFFIFSILILYYWRKLDKDMRMYIIYSFIYTVLSLMLTILHMVSVTKNSDNPEYMYYFIFGRYLDPILPTIFIIGLISWNMFLGHDTKKFIFIVIPTIFFLIVTYPYYALYKVVNMISIYYIKDNLYIIFILPTILSFLTLVLFKKPKVLISILIILSILVSISPFVWLKTANNWSESKNDIGKFLSDERDKNVLFDKETFNDYTTYIIKFWAMPNNLIYEPNITDSADMMNIKYIVTRKPLPYEVILLSLDNILYKNDTIRNTQMVPATGFYISKYDDGRIYNTWIGDDATLYVYAQNTSNESLTTKTISFYKPRNLRTYLNGELINEENITTNVTSTNVQLILSPGENKIRFYVPDGCTRPIDISYNDDTRCISIHFQEISLSRGQYG